MDWDKLKFTKLDNEVMEFLFKNPTTTFTGKELAYEVGASQTAIAKSIRRLNNAGMVNRTKKVLLSISLNRDNKEIYNLKRAYNLKSIYSSELLNKLSLELPGSTIILFGSYSTGEDTEKSDIDIAIVGYKKKKIDLEEKEKILSRKIQIHYYENLKDIDKNLKESIINGITLKGAITL